MLCISVAYAVMRCPSVHLSVRPFVDSVKTSKHIFKNLPSGSQTVLVFPYQTTWQHSDRDPRTGASNAGVEGTKRDCRRYSWLSIDDVLGLWTTTAADYLSQPAASAACTTTTKTGEQNNVRSVKSEAELAVDVLKLMTDTKHLTPLMHYRFP